MHTVMPMITGTVHQYSVPRKTLHQHFLLIYIYQPIQQLTQQTLQIQYASFPTKHYQLHITQYPPRDCLSAIIINLPSTFSKQSISHLH